MVATEDDVLNAIFRFKFKRPSDVQKAAFCEQLVHVVDGVVGDILATPTVDEDGDEDDDDTVISDGDDDEQACDEATMHLDPLAHDRDVPLDVFTASDCVFLERARREYSPRSGDATAAPTKGEMWTEKWYPKYASALQMECVSAGTVALRLVALDGWKRVVHFLPKAECVHSAVPEKLDVLHCGQLEWSDYAKFGQALVKELKVAKERTGNKRHATLGEGSGHQKTPSFLCASIRTALSLGKEAHKPNGGTTDVGMHTGGQARNTCWPLVRSALKQALPGSSIVFDKVLLRLQCTLLEAQIKRLSEVHGVGSFWEAADTAFAMLQTVVATVTGLIDRGYASSYHERRCARWRAEIDALAERWSSDPQRSFTLPDRETLESISNSAEIPVLARPEPQDVHGTDGAFESGRAKALAENRGYEVVDASTCTTEQLLCYLREAATSGVEDQESIGRRMVEVFMNRLAEGLVAPASNVTTCEPLALLEITNWYRSRRERFGTTRDYSELARVTTDSQLLLMSWIAFCICHKTCCETYEPLQRHQIALNWKRLSVAVLPEKESRTALLHVVAYIQRWNRCSGLLPSVFNFSDPEGTILLARTMGQHLSAYAEIYKQHLTTRSAAIAQFWTKVEQRKQRVDDLRSRVTEEQHALKNAQANYQQEDNNIAWKKQRGQYVSRDLLFQYEARVRSLLQSIQRMQDEVTHQVKLHEFYVSPLPADKIEALAVLFLNYLPPQLDVLSELCGLAQRELGFDDSSSYLVSPPCNTSWAGHIAEHGRGVSNGEPTKYTTEYPWELKVPSKCGPETIDGVYSQEHFARECSWYPYGTIRILWQDRSRKTEEFVDPFMISESDSMRHFTSDVPSDDSMPWAVEYPGGPTRGNLTYAKSRVVNAANDDFAAYVALGSLRSYPVHQLRRLFSAIEANTFDWSEQIVAIAVKQAAFQVGTMTDNPMPQLEWHSDLDRPSSLDNFGEMIDAVATRVGASPSMWKCIPLLGELAGFLDQFRRDGRQAVRSLASTARRLADEDRKIWLTGVPTEERTELRTRECLLYGFALSCYSFGPCDAEDLESICKLIVRFANANLFATGKLRQDVQNIQHVVRRVMSIRLVAVVKLIISSPSAVLTRLCVLVNDSVPPGLQWSVVASGNDRSPCCFEATDTERRVHYLVNILTGSILTNGFPPGGLPPDIRKHEQFKMLFGDQDFEVTRHDDMYKTAQKLRESVYAFRLTGDRLLVEETSPMAQLQLCPRAWLDEFDSVFPTTLSSLYAHWYWKEQACVLVRHKLVSERAVLFVVKFEDERARCFEVARSDQDLNYADIVSRTDEYNVLIAHNESVSRVFSKLERLEFVHVMVSPQANLEVHLPRFGLRFVQNELGQLISSEYRGYCLSTNQQLWGQLYRFDRYLVLEFATTACEKTARRVLIPCGPVVELEDGNVDIDVLPSPNASVSLAVAEEHPRLKSFSAESLENRLLLAAVYSASDNLVPWKALGMTGGQASNVLLRGSRSTRPYSQLSSLALQNIYESSHLTTALRLQVNGLAAQASRQAFLFPDAAKGGSVVHDTRSELDAYAAGSRLARASECGLRGALMFDEETSALGRSVLRTPTRSYRDTLRSSIEVGKVPVNSNWVQTVEATLARLVGTVPQDATPLFPLATGALNYLGKELVAELKASWDVYHQEPPQDPKVDLRALARECRVQLHSVVEKRSALWNYLDDAVALARHTSKEKLLTAAGFLPTLTMTDILRSVVDKATLLHFTATLSTQGRGRFKRAALRFMELCVLEDKLERIISRAEATSPPPTEYFVEELTCVRQWKAEEHPYWLVFEVEGRLQIRPEQYIVAQHLIENPGSICQLNMGRGKTRVILPMLFVYYRYAAAGRVVRAHFLSPLLSETRQFMHRVLSSGSLRLPFVELPFNRTIALGLREVLKMQEVVDEVKKSGGFLIVAPEHRLSLELKRLEIEQSGIEGKEAICGALDALLKGSQYIDIFDESDSLLHHKYHLVYAVGSPAVLDGGSARWLAAEALLRVLMSRTSKRIMDVRIKFPDLFSVRPEYASRCGAYDGFTLSTAIKATSERRAELRRALVEDLFDLDPRDLAPYDLSWFTTVTNSSPTVRSKLVAALTDSQLECSAALSALPTHRDSVREQFLALRGFVAYGVLESCLEKRNRVSYGQPNVNTREKALAIPFTAADLPAERSEFSHPDVSIVLTLLAYYHAGLTETEVRKAFVLLLRLDVSEREQFYCEWFKSVEAKIGSEHRSMLSELDHVSLDNAHQFAILVKVYQFSTEVINFYLNRHVFPRDTKQYPQRLSRTAWDLVRGPTNIGFSGTNDTHRLLPVGVTQREPNLASLRGTNGKMIDLLLTSTIGYEAVATRSVSDGNPSVPTWQLLLLQALEKSCRALIDTGALLAGVALEGAARFLIEQPDFSAAGVTYYDSRKAFDCWVVLERSHLLTRPLKTSSVHERDTLVIFDEARSRGSDMKLSPETVALLTLGPTITKDKLMQGAGRLRQLGRNQKLWFSSTKEVELMLRGGHPESSSVKVLDILNWTMQNTQQQNAMGLLEWAHNGIQYGKALESDSNELQKEDWRLDTLYGDAVTDMSIYDVITRQLQATCIEEVGPSGGSSTSIVHVVESRAQKYGREDTVRVTGFGEECERELHLDKDEEKELEKPNLELKPREDDEWEYRGLLSASCIEDVKRLVPVRSAHHALLKRARPSKFCDIAWSLTKIFGTKNFWSTVLPPRHEGDDFPWTGLLRIADVVITFQDQSILMLSEREADAVLKMLLVASSDDVSVAHQRGCFGVVHVSLAMQAICHGDSVGMGVPLAKIPLSLGFVRGHRCIPEAMTMSVHGIVACQLLNGDTQFASRSPTRSASDLVETVLRELLRPLHKQRELTLRAFVMNRRMEQRWSRSFLQELTKRLDQEDDALEKVMEQGDGGALKQAAAA